MAEPKPSPAFYARTGGAAADWWTVLHPPYTLWILSNAAIGAALAPDLDLLTLLGCLVAFFLGVGVAAHALDELSGRPLSTGLSDRALVAAAALSLLAAAGIGVAGSWYVSRWPLVLVIPVGVVLVLGYNLELFGGRLHNDAGFALSWGGFPVLVGYVAQTPGWNVRVVLVGLGGIALGILLAVAQRRLSTPARGLRRHVIGVSGSVTRSDGEDVELTRELLLAPLEGTLRTLCWAVPVLALTLLASHLFG